MANRQTGWNPKRYVDSMNRKRYNSPQKIETHEAMTRNWEDKFIDDGAMQLNDTENGEGIAPIKKKKPDFQRYSDAIRNQIVNRKQQRKR